MKRPSFQFYPGDWLNDAALRMVSVSARGLWIEMICLMHQGSDYGHLKVNGKAITVPQIARMVGASVGEVEEWLAELEAAGVFARDEEGTIMSRRMVRDEELRNIRAAGGKNGGNPALVGEYNEPGFVYAMQRASDGAVKIGISKHPAKRAYRIRQQYPNDVITLLAQLHVDDMGARENELHTCYAHCKDGEWFSLSAAERLELLEIHLKGKSKAKPKVIQTPSISSSSSSSPSGGKQKAPPAALPDWLPLESWNGYLEMRKRNKKVPTERAIELLLKALDGMRASGQDIAAVLDKSTQNNWTDVYPIREDRRAPGSPVEGGRRMNRQEQLEADNRAIADQLARDMGLPMED